MLAEIMSAQFVLQAWKKNHKLTKREIGVFGQWKTDDPNNDKPLTRQEVENFKSGLFKNSPGTYFKLFPFDRVIFFFRRLLRYKN